MFIYKHNRKVRHPSYLKNEIENNGPYFEIY